MSKIKNKQLTVGVSLGSIVIGAFVGEGVFTVGSSVGLDVTGASEGGGEGRGVGSGVMG